LLLIAISNNYNRFLAYPGLEVSPTLWRRSSTRCRAYIHRNLSQRCAGFRWFRCCKQTKLV